MTKVILSILMSMLEQVSAEDVKDIVDTVLDKLEVIAHRDTGSAKSKVIIIGCDNIRRWFDVPDDDEDQLNPQ